MAGLGKKYFKGRGEDSYGGHENEKQSSYINLMKTKRLAHWASVGSFTVTVLHFTKSNDARAGRFRVWSVCMANGDGGLCFPFLKQLRTGTEDKGGPIV